MMVARRDKATPRFLDLFVMPLRGSVAGSREAEIAASIVRDRFNTAAAAAAR